MKEVSGVIGVGSGTPYTTYRLHGRPEVLRCLQQSSAMVLSSSKWYSTWDHGRLGRRLLSLRWPVVQANSMVLTYLHHCVSNFACNLMKLWRSSMLCLPLLPWKKQTKDPLPPSMEVGSEVFVVSLTLPLVLQGDWGSRSPRSASVAFRFAPNVV